jgi:hypothetical protein
MNERIKQLMLEAGYAAPELAERANKLIELILFECVKIAVFKGDTATAQAIKEHFEVEL